VNFNYDRLSHFVEKERKRRIRNDKRIWSCKSYNIFTEGSNEELIAKVRHERRERNKIIIVDSVNKYFVFMSLLCWFFFYLKDYVIFASIFLVYIHWIFSHCKETLLFPHHLEVDRLAHFFKNDFPSKPNSFSLHF